VEYKGKGSTQKSKATEVAFPHGEREPGRKKANRHAEGKASEKVANAVGGKNRGHTKLGEGTKKTVCCDTSWPLRIKVYAVGVKGERKTLLGSRKTKEGCAWQ